MSATQIDLARISILSLRDRLNDIAAVVHSAAAAGRQLDRTMAEELAAADLAIRAVMEDLATVCAENLEIIPEQPTEKLF